MKQKILNYLLFTTFTFMLVITSIFLLDNAIKKCELNNNTNFLQVDYDDKISDCLNF